MPHRVLEEVDRAFDADTMFTTGCGITQIWSGQLQKIDKPRRYLPSGGAGTLGYEVPAAFGAKVADPAHYSVTVVGTSALRSWARRSPSARPFKSRSSW